MNRDQTPMPVVSSEQADDVEALYLELLRLFYKAEDRERAREPAARLEALLSDRPDVAGSIRGEEILSLIAELKGDLPEATRYRESEIRKILELHSFAWGKPYWDYVIRQYNYGDVSDRLDLLAELYADQGDWGRAIATLEESKAYCQAHGIEFDGEDLLAEFRQAKETARKGSKRSRDQ
jgi:hypothetical protein